MLFNRKKVIYSQSFNQFWYFFLNTKLHIEVDFNSRKSSRSTWIDRINIYKIEKRSVASFLENRFKNVEYDRNQCRHHTTNTTSA